MKNITKQTLETIRKSKVHPKPKWQFIIKNFVIWSVYVGTAILAGLAIGLVVLLVKDTDFAAYKLFERGLFKHILFTLPYIWFLLTALFTIIALHAVHHTKQAYRIHPFIIISTSIGLSVVLGGVIFAAGLAQKIDSQLGSHMPIYNKIVSHRAERWHNPNQGRITGTVTNVINLDNFFIITEHHKPRTWHILSKQKNIIYPFIWHDTDTDFIVEGRQVRIIGTPKNEQIFEALLVLPWQKVRLKEMNEYMRINN